MKKTLILMIIGLGAVLAQASEEAKPVKVYILSGQSNMNTMQRDVALLQTNFPGVQFPPENVWFVESGYRGGVPKGGRWGVETPFVLDLIKEIKDPVEGGFIKSMSVSLWLQTTTGHMGDAITKYVPDKAHRSMKDGWRVAISAYGATGLEAVHDGVTEWKSNPKSKGRPHVHAYKTGTSAAFGDGVEWHHVVVVYDGANRTMRAYVDAGFDVNPRKNPWAEDIPGEGLVPSGAPLSIRAGSGEPSALDEVAIWNRALTDDEIKALYNNGNGVKLEF